MYALVKILNETLVKIIEKELKFANFTTFGGKFRFFRQISSHFPTRCHSHVTLECASS